MARGIKTGGRMRGTPNRRTLEVIERLDLLGCDPLEGMARIAMDAANPIELRGRMFAELASYVYPKRRAVEVKGDEGPQITFHLHTDSVACERPSLDTSQP